MASKIDIFNQALAHVGVSTTVASETDRTPERVICSRFWDSCLDSLFAYKSMPWAFAVNTVALADIGSPPAGWAFRYRYPSDCITALGIFDESMRQVPHDLRPSFEIQYEEDGRSIVCDVEAARLKYVKRVAEPERWPTVFADAMGYRLASLIAMPIKNDAGLRNDMLALADQFTQIAMAATLNEQQQEPAGPSIYEEELHA